MTTRIRGRHVEPDDAVGLSVLVASGAVVTLGLGAALFAVSGVAFTGLVLAWFAIVGASLVMLGCGVTWTLDRLARRLTIGRGQRIAAATFIVTAVAAWSVWSGLGSPSQGTLTEAVPTLVDPIIAALFGLGARRR